MVALAQFFFLTAIVRCDNDSVFTDRRDRHGLSDHKFRSYCRQSGITLQYSTPNKGHADRAEHAISRLRATQRSMLLRAPLDKDRFCCDALVAAAYTLNRLPMPKNGKVPMALWYDKPCDVSHLRAWGSPCVVHVALESRGRNKHTDVGQDGYFIGYDTVLHHRYMVYVPATRRILWRESVYFKRRCSAPGLASNLSCDCRACTSCGVFCPSCAPFGFRGGGNRR